MDSSVGGRGLNPASPLVRCPKVPKLTTSLQDALLVHDLLLLQQQPRDLGGLNYQGHRSHRVSPSCSHPIGWSTADY